MHVITYYLKYNDCWLAYVYSEVLHSVDDLMCALSEFK